MNAKLKNSGLAFTLVEILVVMSLILVLMALLVPAFNSINRGTTVSKAVYDIAATLEQARAHAVANHTYVWVGIGEFDALKDASVSPQTSGTGRVVVAVVASKDGARGYDVMDGSLAIPPWPTNTGTTLTPVMPLQYFDHLHLARSGVLNGIGAPGVNGASVGSGRMLRHYINSDSTQPYILSAESTGCVTQFAWPLGAGLNSPQAKYNFSTVINFDSQGVARIQTKTNRDDIVQYLEAGLESTYGSRVKAGEANIAAIQINCATGGVRPYRP